MMLSTAEVRDERDTGRDWHNRQADDPTFDSTHVFVAPAQVELKPHRQTNRNETLASRQPSLDTQHYSLWVARRLQKPEVSTTKTGTTQRQMTRLSTLTLTGDQHHRKRFCKLL